MSKDNDLGLFLRKLETHAVLSDADRAIILALPFTMQTVEPLTYLVREGERMQQCPVLLSGYAYRQKLTGEGARQILSIHIPGEALDFENVFLDQADHNVQALTSCRVAMIPRQALLDLVGASPSVVNAILVSILVEASIFREWILNVGRRDAKTRMAHMLCELAVRLQAQGLGAEECYELPMTQEQLGDALGLTAVHVNRTLRTLSEEGLIVRNRRQVCFPKWRALLEVADFNANYLHLQPQPDPRA